MTISTTKQLEVGPKELDELDSLASRMGWPHAARVLLASLGAQTPKKWDDEKAKESATAYYAKGPASASCPHLLGRAWLDAYSGQCPGTTVRFPHIDAITRS